MLFEGRNGDESGHLIAGVQCLLEGAFPRDIRVVGVRQDRTHDPVRIPTALQFLAATERMIGWRRVAFVVEVVQQRDDTPGGLVFAERPRVAAHGGLDRERMLAQALAYGPLRE